MELLRRIEQGPPWTFGEWSALEGLAHYLVLRAAEVGMTNALAEAADKGPPEPVEVHLAWHDVIRAQMPDGGRDRAEVVDDLALAQRWRWKVATGGEELAWRVRRAMPAELVAAMLPPN